MHLRANTFLPTLFVSLLCVASTFAIPISPDSDSTHDFLSDAQSPKLVDRDVVLQLIDARADAPPPSYESAPYAKKPLEARVLLQCDPLAKEDQTALKSAIETMLKPAVSAFRSEAQRGLKEKLPTLNVNDFPKVKAIPVTVINYESSSEVDSTSNTEYQFKFTIAGKLNVLHDGQRCSEHDTSCGTFEIGGYPFHGTIARASLSNGGKKLTGKIWAMNLQTSQYDKLVSFKKGNAKTQNRLSDALGRLGLTW
ncbi:hypothetical protein DFJ43DRAFT_1079549 [Lentinula guzmanii]|uniref:Uncharacterized protein n=1 Tax=Lentinula guzmanii TaxID=2804957 RepID=A0AA38MZD2_9AGAR|nr:hypothetical protein DFJ43DRAFT_1079549 [Lentinula guzmanii]